MSENTIISNITIRKSISIVFTLLGFQLLFSLLMLFKFVINQNILFLLTTVFSSAALLWYLFRHELLYFRELFYVGIKPNFKIILLLGLASASLLIGFIDPLVSSIPMPDFVRKFMMEMFCKTDIFSFITIVIAAPLLEELIFRGVILNGFLHNYSPKKAIVVSAVLFGFVHLNPWQFVGATLLGLFMGWIYYKTHCIWLTIFIHFMNNLIGFLVNTNSKAIDHPTIEVLELGPYTGVIVLTAMLLCAGSIYLLNKEFSKHKNKFQEMQPECAEIDT